MNICEYGKAKTEVLLCGLNSRHFRNFRDFQNDRKLGSELQAL